MSHESEHSLEESEEGNVRFRSPDPHRDSILERMLESMEKVSAGQNNLDKRLNDVMTGQNNLDKRLNDRLKDITGGQADIRLRLGDLFEGQSELSRNQSELARSHAEVKEDQRRLLHRIECLESERQVSNVSHEVST